MLTNQWAISFGLWLVRGAMRGTFLLAQNNRWFLIKKKQSLRQNFGELKLTLTL